MTFYNCLQVFSLHNLYNNIGSSGFSTSYFVPSFWPYDSGYTCRLGSTLSTWPHRTTRTPCLIKPLRKLSTAMLDSHTIKIPKGLFSISRAHISKKMLLLWFRFRNRFCKAPTDDLKKRFICTYSFP